MWGTSRSTNPPNRAQHQVTMPVAKKAAKKPVKVPAGVHLRKSAKGFSLHVHSKNGNKLAVLTGYNSKANALKGLLALNIALNEAFDKVEGNYKFHDHTVAPKKVVKKK